MKTLNEILLVLLFVIIFYSLSLAVSMWVVCTYFELLPVD